MDTPKPSVPIPKPKKSGMKGYWSEVSRELKKVDWPPVKEVHRLTGVVIVVCAMVIGVLYALSRVAETLVQLIQGK